MENAGEGSSKGIGRKGFIELAGAVAGIAVATYVTKRLGIKSETPRSPEVKLQPSISVMDIFDTESIRDRFMRENLPEQYSVKEALKQMGVGDISGQKELLKAIPQTKEQAAIIILKAVELRFKDHGSDIIGVINTVSDHLNHGEVKGEISKQTIVSAARIENIGFDPIGNPEGEVSVSFDAIDNLVSRTKESIINMSFEMGEFDISYTLYSERPRFPELARQLPVSTTIGEVTTYTDYQGNPITKEEYDLVIERSKEKEAILLPPIDRKINYLDGYAGENCTQNFMQLVKIAGRYPEKMFIAAAGNPTYLKGIKYPDIRKVRMRLEEEGLWPDNLIMVGYETRENRRTLPASLGADIYVTDKDLEMLGFSGASSYATPVITAIVRDMVHKGYDTHNKVKEKLFELCDKKEVFFGSESVQYRLLNMSKAKQSL